MEEKQRYQLFIPHVVGRLRCTYNAVQLRIQARDEIQLLRLDYSSLSDAQLTALGFYNAPGC